MSGDSRSPKRERHHRNEKSSRRERSREREKSTSYSKSTRKQHSREDYHRSHDSTISSSSRKFDTQRGIDAAQNRMRALLNTAITDFKVKDREVNNSAEDKHDFSDSLSVLDSLNRQNAIEQIQQNSFVPSQFTSSNTPQELLKQKAKKNEHNVADVKTHDKAMFGALWTSKEIERKLLKENNNVKKEEPEVEVKDSSQSKPSIAHERLFSNPSIKKQKWLELFRERRKALIGDSISEF